MPRKGDVRIFLFGDDEVLIETVSTQKLRHQLPTDPVFLDSIYLSTGEMFL